MKYFYAVLALVVAGILEFIGITMADKIEKIIPNKVVSTAIVIIYCVAVFALLVFIQIKLGIFGER